MEASQKKSPKDATEFEREQLRFLMIRDDAAVILAEVNPSLAWLPMLAELKLLNDGGQLASWVEKNFSEVEAIREVVLNIRFFNPETADILEMQLNGMEGLSPLLMKCWRLVIRQMRSTKRGSLRGDWFDIEPRIKGGENSPELLERIAYVFRPKLKIGERNSWYDEGRSEPQRPSDLMSIEYEIENNVTDEDVLSVWPESALAEVDCKLLQRLTNALKDVLEDAADVGVESDSHYSISDTDVPSVGKHSQNDHHSGFLPIVRVMADLWTRLAQKNAQLALPFLKLWGESPFRLERRLALFAAADPTVLADTAAHLLLSLSQGELFLSNSSVEVYRLIDNRWRDFPSDKRQAIEKRIAEGPSADRFREGSETDELIDRCRFDILGHIERNGDDLSASARSVLKDIRERHPKWELRPQEQAGFHIWHSGVRDVVGDPDKLRGFEDDQLIDEAKRLVDTRSPNEGAAWRALCESDPRRAFRGLQAESEAGRWPPWAWDPFLWAGQKIGDRDIETRIAQLLLEWPERQFSQISDSVSWWLKENAKMLDDSLLWPLWDRIEQTGRQEAIEPHDE